MVSAMYCTIQTIHKLHILGSNFSLKRTANNISFRYKCTTIYYNSESYCSFARTHNNVVIDALQSARQDALDIH